MCIEFGRAVGIAPRGGIVIQCWRSGGYKFIGSSMCALMIYKMRKRVASLDSSMERHDPVIKLAVLTRRERARHGCRLSDGCDV